MLFLLLPGRSTGGGDDGSHQWPATTTLKEGSSAPVEVAAGAEGGKEEQPRGEEEAPEDLDPERLRAGGVLADELLRPLALALALAGAGEPPPGVILLSVAAHGTVGATAALHPPTAAVEGRVEETTETAALLHVAVGARRHRTPTLTVDVAQTAWPLLHAALLVLQCRR